AETPLQMEIGAQARELVRAKIDLDMEQDVDRGREVNRKEIAQIAVGDLRQREAGGSFHRIDQVDRERRIAEVRRCGIAGIGVLIQMHIEKRQLAISLEVPQREDEANREG